MASDFLSASKLSKRVAVAAGAVATLLYVAGVGTHWIFTKQTPTGMSASRDIVCWKSASGSGLCIDETGGVRGSGSFVANGITLGAGGGGGGSTNTGALMSLAEGMFVNQGGDAMTGSLTLHSNGNIFVATLDANDGYGAYMQFGGPDGSNNGYAYTVYVPPFQATDLISISSGASLYMGMDASGAVSFSEEISLDSVSGAGLADCDTADTSKVLWDDTTKQFSCGTDQGGGAITNPFTGTFVVHGTASGTTVKAKSLSGALTTNIGSTAPGNAVCWMTDGKLGYCADIVDANGECPCNALP